MSWRGFSKRRMSPTSTANVTAVTSSTPRSAWSASTTGARPQVGRNSSIARSIRARRSSASRTSSISSWSTIWSAGCSKLCSCSQQRYRAPQFFLRGKSRLWRSRKALTWRLFAPTSLAAAARARTRPRIASWAVSGTQTAVSSPARRSRARLTASRRLILTRSLGLLGISEGATTTPAWPSPVSNRWSPYPVGPLIAPRSTVAEVQVLVLAGQLRRQAAHAGRRRVHLAVEPHLAIASSVSDRHRMAQLRYVDPDECFLVLGHKLSSSGEEQLVASARLICRAGGGTNRRLRRRTYGLIALPPTPIVRVVFDKIGATNYVAP